MQSAVTLVFLFMLLHKTQVYTSVAVADIIGIAQLDVTDCNILQHSKWHGLCCREGELCRPPCENGGRCLANEKGDWRCYCWPDFSGERCEVNHCTDYCLNGGTCMGSPLGKSTLKHTHISHLILDSSLNSLQGCKYCTIFHIYFSLHQPMVYLHSYLYLSVSYFQYSHHYMQTWS